MGTAQLHQHKLTLIEHGMWSIMQFLGWQGGAAGDSGVWCRGQEGLWRLHSCNAFVSLLYCFGSQTLCLMVCAGSLAASARQPGVSNL